MTKVTASKERVTYFATPPSGNSSLDTRGRTNSGILLTILTCCSSSGASGTSRSTCIVEPTVDSVEVVDNSDGSSAETVTENGKRA